MDRGVDKLVSAVAVHADKIKAGIESALVRLTMYLLST